MNDMNNEFIQRVRTRMGYGKSRVSQAELARKLGKSPNYINRVFNGHDGKMPDVWQGILEELDMTV
ncbi:MAG: helix-turn-helix transcriptional regulator, partial [Bacteroidetes bacterium]|nr:helix-turn-helix transcriptional regulator [Bacteroidota bacterium]